MERDRDRVIVRSEVTDSKNGIHKKFDMVSRGEKVASQLKEAISERCQIINSPCPVNNTHFVTHVTNSYHKKSEVSQATARKEKQKLKSQKDTIQARAGDDRR